jgi:hypothetical protein
MDLTTSRSAPSSAGRQRARDLQIISVELVSLQHGAIVEVNAPEGDDLPKDLAPDPDADGTRIPFYRISERRRVKWSDPIEGCASDQHGTLADSFEVLRPLLDVARLGNLALQVGELHHEPEDGIERQIGRQGLALFGKFILRPEIIGIEKRKELSTGLGDARIRGSRCALVRLPQNPDGRPEPGGDVSRSISRTVVNDNDLVGWKGLMEHAAKGRRDKIAPVMDWNDDGDHGAR